jgi:DNA-binding response OmpR family regulator
MATVLVVDDDPQARKPLARLIEMEGHRVLTADNAIGAMATAASRDERPDLIILDVSMPPLDGLTFLFLLREKPFGKDIPVIVVSGHDDDQTMRRARDLGVIRYFVKTHFKTNELLEVVRQHCPAAATAAAEEGAGI